MLKNLTIRTKLFTVLGLMAAVAIGLTFLATSKLAGINDQLNNIVEVTSVRALLSAQINEDLLAIHRAEKNMILADTDADMDRYAKNMEKATTGMQEKLGQLEKIASEEGKKRIAEFRTAFDEYKTVSAQVQEATRRNTNLQAFQLSSGQGRQQYDKAEQLLKAIADRGDQEVSGQVKKLMDLKDQRIEEAAKAADTASTRALLSARCVQDLLALHRAEKNLILATKVEDMDQYAKAIEQRKTSLEEKLKEIEKTASAQDKQDIATFRQAFAEFLATDQKVCALTRENSNTVARDLSGTKGRAAIDKAQQAMEAIAEMANQAMKDDARTSDEAYAAAKWMMYSVSFIGIVIAVGLGFLVITGVVGAIRKAMEVIKAFAAGDYSQRLEIDSKDEIGQMAVSLNQAIGATAKAMDDVKEAAEREKEAQAQKAAEERQRAEAQRREVEEADRKVKHILEVATQVARRDYSRQVEVTGSDALGQLGDGLKKFFADKKTTEEREAEAAEKDRIAAEILRRKVDHLLEVVAAAAQGDLTRTVKVEGTEPVDELAAGIKKMLEDLASVIGQVTESAAQFNEGSRVIAESSQGLASGAQQQSSSVEEMTASIEELARSIEGVKENSVEADKMAKRTSQLAEHGGEAVKRSIESMELIRTSSQQIGEIIQVISEIASQTNLLALNAAIEAARAGEHGMGFAVVADEVRKLAERSNQAAREISTLIKESTQRVEEGAQISTETAKSFQEIIAGVTDTAGKISEIAAAAVQQAANAEEVSKAIQGVAHVTEQSAAGSEEMASSSEELGAQASALRQLVTRFKVEG